MEKRWKNKRVWGRRTGGESKGGEYGREEVVKGGNKEEKQRTSGQLAPSVLYCWEVTGREENHTPGNQ